MNHGSGEVHCDDVIDQLVELEEGGGSAEMREHCNTCATCQARLRDAQTLLVTLGKLPAVPLPTGFEARLHAQLHATPLARRMRPARAWAAAGIALAAALAVVLWWRAPRDVAVELTLSQMVSVDVALEVQAAMPDVRMRVALPVGLHMASDDPDLASLREVAYSTPLPAGTHHLNLVLRAKHFGEHRLRVQVDAGTEHAAMDVVLQVHPDAHAQARVEMHAHTAGLGFRGVS